MTTGGPAGTGAGGAIAVSAATDGEVVAWELLLEVALEAEVGIPLGEHLLIDGTVWVMAGRATFTNGFVLEGEGAGLDSVAIRAGVVDLGYRGAALMRVMAIAAAHLASEHRMAVGHRELSLLVEMALEAGFWRFLGVDDGASAAAGFHVLAAWAVAGFATHVLGVFTFDLEFGVVRSAEVLGDIFMAGGAGIRANESGTGDAGRSHHDPRGGAGHQDNGE